MGAPTTEELEVLKKFRLLIADLELAEEDLTDDALLKWLRARELDLEKANAMFRKSLQWRVENDVANIMSWKPPEHYRKEFPYEIYGYTLKGCPVINFDVGKWNFKIITDPVERELFLKYNYLILAEIHLKIKKYRENNPEQKKCENNTNESTRTETQYVSIANFEGFSIMQLTSLSGLSAMRAFTLKFEANYPECIHKIYVINASWIFLSFFKIVKPWLTPRTLAKIQIFGSNRQEWEPVLLQNIPADQLGVRYGGTYKEKTV